MNSVLLFKLLPLLSLLLSTQPLPSHARPHAQQATANLAAHRLAASAVLAVSLCLRSLASPPTSATTPRAPTRRTRSRIARDDGPLAQTDCNSRSAEMSRLGRGGSPAYSLHLEQLADLGQLRSLTDEEMLH
ncbi:uncharacterized protein A4U43_C08F3490 [Asparagus officinalis]|nr:uncharacterized protein A4U43_C08F3490 [Asparagus officinalis]